jgi:hypothetical protein
MLMAATPRSDRHWTARLRKQASLTIHIITRGLNMADHDKTLSTGIVVSGY